MPGIRSPRFTVAGELHVGLPIKFRQKLPHLTAVDGAVTRKVVREILQDLAKEVEFSVIAADPKELNE